MGSDGEGTGGQDDPWGWVGVGPGMGSAVSLGWSRQPPQARDTTSPAGYPEALTSEL